MGGETPELALEQVPQDASTKKLSECLKRIGDELDSNMELQRCGPWAPGVPALRPLFPLGAWSSDPQLPTLSDPGVQLPPAPSTLDSQLFPPLEY